MKLLTTDSQRTRTAESQPEMQSRVDRWLKMLANDWQGSVLTLESDSQDMTKNPFFSSLTDDISRALTPVLSRYDTTQLPSIFAAAGRMLRSFLESRSVISAIDRHGLIDLITLLIKSVIQQFPRSLKNIEIRIGFSATPTEVPNARIPAYVLAAKKILSCLKNESVALPKIILYSATNFVADVNSGDGDRTLKAADDNFNFISRYLQRFCDPAIASRFSFDEDRRVEKGESLDALVAYYAQTLEQAANPDSVKARDRVIDMGLKYGSTRQNAARYAAAHAVYAADAIPGPSGRILRSSEARPAAVIMIGGLPEKTFWKVRETIRRGVTVANAIQYCRDRFSQISCPVEADGYEKLRSRFEECTSEDGPQYSRVQLISEAGQMAVYGMYRGDWSIRDVAARSFDELLVAPFDLRMKRDLLAVLCDIANVPQEKAYSMTAKKPLDAETADALRTAYGQYADFCREFLTQI